MRRATLQYNISMTSQAYTGQYDEDRMANKAATCFMMQYIGRQDATESANNMSKCRKKARLLESSLATGMRLSSDPGSLADKRSGPGLNLWEACFPRPEVSLPIEYIWVVTEMHSGRLVYVWLRVRLEQLNRAIQGPGEHSKTYRIIAQKGDKQWELAGVALNFGLGSGRSHAWC